MAAFATKPSNVADTTMRASRDLQRSRRITVTVVLLATSVGLALFLSLGRNSGAPSSSDQRQAGSTEGAHFLHGTLVNSVSVATQTRTLDAALDSCFRTHGAAPVVLGTG